jgi:ABC-type polysaccharide/polyol phosphate export permease
LILLFFFHVPLTVYALFFFVIFIIQFIFTFALSLFLSWTNLFYRDIQYLLSLILTLWFYLTPIIYPVEFFPEKYRFIFKLNPMSVFINAYRQVLLGGDFPRFESLAIGIAISLIAFLVSYSIFKKVEKTLADVV